MDETSPRWLAGLILAALVVAHATFGALFTPIGVATSQYPRVGAYLAIGAIGIQPVLFAMWAALGPDSLFKRFAWAAAACALVAYARSIPSFRLVGKSAAKTNPFQELLFTLLIFGITALILFVVQWRFSWCIHQPVTNSAHKAGDLQFSVKYLLGWITASAVLLAVGRVLADADATEGPASRQAVGHFLSFVGMFCVVLFPAVGVPCLVLAYRRRACFFVIGGLLAWGALTWAAVSVLRAVTRASPTEAVSAIVFIQVGAGVAGFFTALLLRIVGFRLERRPKTHVTTDMKMPPRLAGPQTVETIDLD
jgi:hypothetical protein